VPSLVIAISAVLVLSCGKIQTDRRIDTQNYTQTQPIDTHTTIVRIMKSEVSAQREVLCAPTLRHGGTGASMSRCYVCQWTFNAGIVGDVYAFLGAGHCLNPTRRQLEQQLNVNVNAFGFPYLFPHFPVPH